MPDVTKVLLTRIGVYPTVETPIRLAQSLGDSAHYEVRIWCSVDR
jgi:hypothetical protein